MIGQRELELQASGEDTARFVASGVLLFGSAENVGAVAELLPAHFGYAAQVLDDAPVAYYRFAELAGAHVLADSSGHGADGIVEVGVAFGHPGAGAGMAARFRASDTPRVRVPDRPALRPAQLSIEALLIWSGGDAPQAMVAKPAAYGLSVLADGRVRAEVDTAGVTSTGALIPGEPTHLVVTFDGTAVAVYLNGVVDTVSPVTGDPTAAGDLAIGGGPNPFDGVLDELALYDHPLPEDRVRAHADAVDAELGNLIRNATFGRSRPSPPPPLTGAGVGGLAAAEEWFVWNNPDATTMTELLPTTRPDGRGHMLHVVTTGGLCGLVQTWTAAGAGPAVAEAWVYVVAGAVGLGCGNGGGTSIDAVSTVTGRWEHLVAEAGSTPVDELIPYFGPADGADFYVDFVVVRPLPAAP
ncbi:LamG domain-containing protein [Streptomyces sp. 8N616]|uniref:LamG domain-containing protein n=1 Tax=Streptomyces sp. 8N616 TaxID=3457414 RepID=UPI003FD657C9